uniref:Short-chain dehydrogenase reductase acting with nad or nadp as acceptor n=2 Tax=Hirondellea gigas TaxID=1518452 RepID=A0A6A7FRW9_9CRUS
MELSVIFSFIGLAVVVRFGFSLCGGVFRSFLRPGKNLKKYGKWAIVTGATDGIGKAFCFEFAKRRLNVLLISRTQSKLDEVAKELEKYRVEVATICVDFSDFGVESQKKVANAVEKLDVGILINNVGLSYPFPRYFMEIDDEFSQKLIDLNVTSTMVMSRIVLPGMLFRHRGAVVNISSASAATAMPLLAGYSAAKSHVLLLSESLNAEYSSKGVHVQCQLPLFVTTKLSKIRKPSFFVCTPAAYARSAVKAIGYESTTSPYWTHKIQLWLLSALPKFLVTNHLKSIHLALRKRGMAKQAKKAE